MGLRRISPAIGRSVPRFLIGLAAIALLSFLTFSATNFRSPIETARSALGRYVDDSQLNAFIVNNGLDRPFLVRYASWAGDMVQGDFGMSIVTRRPVVEDIAPALANTALLAGLALLFSIPIGILLGIWTANLRSGYSTTYIIVLSAFVAIPDFVFAVVLIYALALSAGLFPAQSALSMAFGDFWEQVGAMILPALAVGLTIVPHITRITQSALTEIFSTPYIQAAVLRGLAWRSIMWDHAMRNAASPILNAVGLNFISMMSGLLVIENLFGFPGIGRLIIESLGSGDTTMLQGAAVCFGAMFIGLNIVIEAIGNYFNPKLRDTL